MIHAQADWWYYLIRKGFKPSDISGFIGWWKGDSIEIDGLTYLKDYSGNEYHALAEDIVGSSDGSKIITLPTSDNSEEVVSNLGDVDVAIYDGVMHIPDGYAASVLLNNDSLYPLAEGGGDTAYDKVNLNHGEWGDLESELVTYVGALTTPISSIRQIRLDNFIKEIKSGLSITNLSEAFDAIYFLDSETEESALRNLVGRFSDATKVGSPAFIKNRGFDLSTDSGSYINTNYNPTSDGVRYTLTDGGMGIFSYVDNDGAAKIDTGVHSSPPNVGSFISPLWTDDKFYYRNNSASSSSKESDRTEGLFSVIREGTEVRAYVNSTLIDTVTSTSDGLPSHDIYIGGYNESTVLSTASERLHGFAFYGKSFTSAEIAIILNAMNRVILRDGYNYYDKSYGDESSPVVSSSDIKFGLISDIHVSRQFTRRPNSVIEKYYKDSPIKLSNAIKSFNDSNDLDFVISLADNIDNEPRVPSEGFDNKTAALYDLNTFNNVFGQLTCDKHNAIGNHDLDQLTRSEFVTGCDSLDSGYYYFDVEKDSMKVRFVVLDGNYDNGSETAYTAGNYDDVWLPVAQQTWLEDTITGYDGKVVVFCHYRLDMGTWQGLINNADVRAILENSGNVISVFSGHGHTSDQNVINGITYNAMEAMVDDYYPSNAYYSAEIDSSYNVTITTHS